MSDFYHSKPMHFSTEGEETTSNDPATAALDALCREPGYLWWARGKTLLLRKRDWYYQRLYEVPDAWIQTLVRHVKEQNGKVTNGDVLSLLDLTTDQIVGLSESSGGQDDRRILAGLRMMLAVMANSPVDRKAPIYAGRVQPATDNSRRATVKPNLADPRMNAFFKALLAEHFPDLLNHPNLADVGLIIVPARPDSKATESVMVATLFPFGDGIRMGYLFNLPLVLPEDHRDKTEVRVIPSGEQEKRADKDHP